MTALLAAAARAAHLVVDQDPPLFADTLAYALLGDRADEFVGHHRLYGQHPLLAGARVGFISPHSHNFCASCNRVRVTAEGRLLLCLGNEHSLDLRRLMREEGANDAALRAAIVQAITLKPERHHFDLQAEPQIVRFMNATGG